MLKKCKPEEKAKFEKKIEKVEAKIEKLMVKKEKIVETQHVRPIYAYIQFRSMEGRDKFVSAFEDDVFKRMNISLFKCCFWKKHKEI